MTHDGAMKVIVKTALFCALAGCFPCPLQGQWDWSPEKRQLGDGDFQASPFLTLFRKLGTKVIGYKVVVGGGYCFSGVWERGKVVNEIIFDLSDYRDTGRRENEISRRPTIEFPMVQEVVPLTRTKEPYSHHVDEFEDCLRILGDPGTVPAPLPAENCASPESLRRRPLDLRAENRDWLFIRETIDGYHERVSSQSEALSIFSRQLHNLVDLSLEGRDEDAGAWSGELARQSLLFIAKDLQVNPGFGIDVVRARGCDSPAVGQLPGADDYCRVLRLGDQHLERHVSGFFREFGKRVLSEAVARPCPVDVRDRVLRELGRVRTAHLLFVARAVLPGFRRVPELNQWEAIFAGWEVEGKALRARQRGLALALSDMATSAAISPTLAESITREYLQDERSDALLPRVPEYDD